MKKVTLVKSLIGALPNQKATAASLGLKKIGNYIVHEDKAVLAGDKELAEKSLKLAIKSLDNAKSKGLIHKNKVDREKSRLAKKVNAM